MFIAMDALFRGWRIICSMKASKRLLGRDFTYTWSIFLHKMLKTLWAVLSFASSVMNVQLHQVIPVKNGELPLASII